MTLINRIVEVFGQYEGAPSDLVGECNRWTTAFAGHEDRLRTFMLQRRRDLRWVPLEEAAAALGVDLGVEAQQATPLGPIARQWSEASTRLPLGPWESRVRAQQMDLVLSRGGVGEDQARDWLNALSAARMADGHSPHRLVGPARYEVEQAHREAWALARSRGRDALSREEERAFAAYFRDADRKDAAAGWEVPASPSAQSEEEGDAGLPPLARRFVEAVKKGGA